MRSSSHYPSGAFGSKGRTSWTGKAEIADYTSFAGFLIHYLHELDLDCACKHNSVHEYPTADSSDAPEKEAGKGHPPLQIVLGGYSYGSMIASKLPSVDYILYRFSTGADGTAFAEIISKARSLAIQTREELRTQFPAKSEPSDTRTSRELHFSHNLQVSGEETTPERRQSSEIRRSIQLVRKFSGLKKKLGVSPNPQPEVSAPRVEPKVRPAYLLISPLLPPISSLISIGRSSDSEKEELQTRLSKYPSLAVFGSNDMFTSAKKLRSWAQQISTKPGSAFQFVEINGAGHFWHEEGVQKRLKLALREWIRGLETSSDS
jgi:hypothetical protein